MYLTSALNKVKHYILEAFKIRNVSVFSTCKTQAKLYFTQLKLARLIGMYFYINNSVTFIQLVNLILDYN